MLAYLTLILVFQLIGELVTAALEIPFPGPVLGMVLLFVFLMIRGSIPPDLAKTGDALLANLSLLFVPAGVGIMTHMRLLGQDWPAIGAALIVSTAATVAVTALAMVWLNRLTGGSHGGSTGAGTGDDAP
jgi:holin-like protein